MDVGRVAAGAADDDEEVCERHFPEFRVRLADWRREVVANLDRARETLRSDDGQAPDAIDRASFEADRAMALRTKDRETKLLVRIDAAIKRLDSGEFGICAATGDALTVGRLRARPIATLCVEAQDRHERGERVARM